MALAESELLDAGRAPRIMLSGLASKFPDRPYESLKKLRHEPRYKEQVARIRAEREVGEEGGRASDSPGNPRTARRGTPRTVPRGAPGSTEGTPKRPPRTPSSPDQGAEGQSQSVPDEGPALSPPPTRSSRFSWPHAIRTVLVTLLVVNSPLTNLVPGGGLVNLERVNEDYAQWAPPCLPERLARVRGTNPLPSSRKRRRLALFSRVQRSWRRDRGRCADSILDGSWEQEEVELPLPAFRTFWGGLFGTESLRDRRSVTPIRPIQWDLMTPISDREIGAALEAMDNRTAPGPDRRDLKILKSIPVSELRVRFNSWLLAGCLPTDLCEGFTTLIAKVHGSVDPKDYRPITVGSVIVRAFHRILASRLDRLCPPSLRQKAFRAGDGINENVEILKGIIKDARTPKKQRELYLCYLDVRKAFDSVSHESLVLAAERAGVPPPLLTYIRSLYSQSGTCLKVNGRLTERISVRGGVKQGDPMSPILFNFVVDWALGDLDKQMGYEFRGTRFNHLAFADDVVLISESAKGLQFQIDRFAAHLARSGLRLNAGKCASYACRVVGGREARKYAIDTVSQFSVTDSVSGVKETMKALGLNECYKYLGISFHTKNGALPDSEKKLEALLRKISRAPLKPQQKLWVLNTKGIPSLLHELVLSDGSKNLLQSLDVKIRTAVRRWCKLPHDTPTGFFHGNPGDGGMGIVSLRYLVPALKVRRLSNLAATQDPVGQQVLDMPDYRRRLTRWTKAAELEGFSTLTSAFRRQAWRQSLLRSVDGKGLATANEFPRVNGWPSNGSRLMQGRNFCGALAVRCNLLPTPARRARFAPEATGACDCCGAGVRGTLAHILQSCPRVKGLRTKRHDRIVALTAKSLRSRGFTVVEEPVIPTSMGNRKPDIVFFDGDRAGVIDVTIVTDNPDNGPDSPHLQKVEKYSAREVVDYVTRLTGLEPIITSVCINWRGVFSPASGLSLRSLGFSWAELELMSVVVVEQGALMFRQWSDGTSRLPGNHRQNHDFPT